MNILISGGTGFIGKLLGRRLVQKSHNLFVITRDKTKHEGLLPYPCQLLEWNELENILPALNIDAAINLAGEPVAQKRWTEKFKKQIRSSRIDTTKKLIQALANTKVKTLVGASATGYYGNRGEEILNEASTPADSFLAQVCVDWENELKKIKSDVRLNIIRIGIVLGEGGGALQEMIPIFQNGIASELGDGQMWMSWIHVKDLVEMFVWSVENPKAQGIYNGVSPNPVRNTDFTKVLADIFHKSVFLPAPRIALKTVLGEMADVVLASQNVQPSRALQDGFSFEYFDVEEALKSVVEPLTPFEKKVIFEQWVPEPIAKVEEELTAHHLIDTQKRGLYKKWQHTHELETLGTGTTIKDTIRYKLHASLVGRLIAGHMADQDVKKIFEDRANKIREIF